MDAIQRYLFDLNGYLVIPDALAPTVVARLDAVMDERIAAEESPNARYQGRPTA